MFLYSCLAGKRQHGVDKGSAACLQHIQKLFLPSGGDPPQLSSRSPDRSLPLPSVVALWPEHQHVYSTFSYVLYYIKGSCMGQRKGAHTAYIHGVQQQSYFPHTHTYMTVWVSRSGRRHHLRGYRGTFCAPRFRVRD